jgi:hypothetical protein
MPRPNHALTRTLLADLPDSNVVVLRKAPDPGGDVLTAAWRAARDDALIAYEAWRKSAAQEGFVVYRAAVDREEAAAAALAGASRKWRTRWHRLRAFVRRNHKLAHQSE